MKKRVLALMLVLGMTFSLAACGSSNDKKSDDTKTETTDKDSKEKMTTVKWNYGSSGNVLVTIAEEEGYFEDEGIEIEPVEATQNMDAMALLAAGKVDVVSNAGTSNPLQQIAQGVDPVSYTHLDVYKRQSLGRTFSDYVAVENDFEEEIQKYKNMEYYDEWKKNAPNSNELDEIISGKRKVATTLQKNEIDNYTVWWSLANDYQNYALEYSVQTTDAEKITFYYMKSIYCCLEVLKFDNDKNVEELIWNYIEQRYKDLLIQDGISQKYREVALEVLDTLDMDAGATID